MNNLTNDMTRLCVEIARSRAARKEEVPEMLGAFREAHAEMARRTKAGLKEFVSRLKEQVADLRQDHQEWISGLKEQVADMRKEFAADNAGAHRAWSNFTAGRGEFREVSEPVMRKGKKGKR